MTRHALLSQHFLRDGPFNEDTEEPPVNITPTGAHYATVLGSHIPVVSVKLARRLAQSSSAGFLQTGTPPSPAVVPSRAQSSFDTMSFSTLSAITDGVIDVLLLCAVLYVTASECEKLLITYYGTLHPSGPLHPTPTSSTSSTSLASVSDPTPPSSSNHPCPPAEGMFDPSFGGLLARTIDKFLAESCSTLSLPSPYSSLPVSSPSTTAPTLSIKMSPCSIIGQIRKSLLGVERNDDSDSDSDSDSGSRSDTTSGPPKWHRPLLAAASALEKHIHCASPLNGLLGGVFPMLSPAVIFNTVSAFHIATGIVAAPTLSDPSLSSTYGNAEAKDKDWFSVVRTPCIFTP